MQTLVSGRFSSQEIRLTEVKVLDDLEYELHGAELFDFVELYLGCFWTTVDGVERTKIELLVYTCVEIIDFTFLDPLMMDDHMDIKLQACAVIACASALVTKSPNNCLALLCWLSMISSHPEQTIRQAANDLTLCVVSKSVDHDKTGVLLYEISNIPSQNFMTTP